MEGIGKYVETKRLQAGYASQRALAFEIGKDPSWLSRLERGTMKELPTPEDLKLLSDAIHVSVPALMAAAGYEVSAPEQLVSQPAQRLIPRIDQVEWTELKFRTMEALLDSWKE